MIALARYLRSQSESSLKIVFIGPCIAKKMEADDPRLPGEIDAVLTFQELRQFLSDSLAPEEDRGQRFRSAPRWLGSSLSGQPRGSAGGWHSRKI